MSVWPDHSAFIIFMIAAYGVIILVWVWFAAMAPWHHCIAVRVAAKEIDAYARTARSRAAEAAMRTRTKPRRRAMSEWRPIETAPRDETVILIGNFSPGETAAYRVAYWHAGEHPDFPWHVDDALDAFAHHVDWPTHWQPLPTPPEDEER